MLYYWGTACDDELKVDRLLQGENMDTYPASEKSNVIYKFKRCFDLADQLFDQTLVQREVLIAACERLKDLIEKIWEKPEQTAAAPYYHLARGNVRFRQALILNRWKPLPYSMCQEAQTCFEEAQKAEDSVCRWLAQHMAAKCEREMEKFRYHHSSDQPVQGETGAFGEFQTIIEELSPDSTELANIALDAVINMGRCQRNQMKYQEAIPYFVAVCAALASKCDDSEGETIIVRQKLLEKYRKIGEGIKNKLNAAVGKRQLEQQSKDKKDPQYLQALVNLVACLTDGPRAYAEAQELALHVLERIDVDNTDMQNNLGRLYRKRKDFLLAEESYRKVMEHLKTERRAKISYFVDETDSLNRYAELELVKCFTGQRDFKKALEQLNRLLGFYDKDPEVLLWKGLCYRNQGQLTQAVEVLKDLCDAEKVIRPGTVGLKARYAMGTCYLPSAPAQAKAWFAQIVQAKISDIPALKNLGWCQQMLGEYQEAIKSYQEVQEYNKNGPYLRRDFTWISTCNDLGQCYLYQENVEQALEQFKKVVEQESSNYIALSGAACCLRRLEKNVKNIDVDFVKKLIGENETESKDFKGMAVALARKAREVAPGNPHVESEYVLCLLSNAKHYKDEKYKLMKQVLNSERVFPQELCVEALAKLAEHVGNKKLSYAPLKAREVAPGNPHVESEYVLCLLSKAEHYEDEKYEKYELVEQVLNSERVFPQELCVEALARLAEYVGDTGASCVPFCALRPMKWEAAAEQVSALVDSPEFQTLEAEQQGKLLAHVYRLHDTMEQIKTTLRLTRKEQGEKSCWHYTSVGTLQKLLIAQGAQAPKFRLTNVAYMNDSAEGESFGKLLEQYGSQSNMLQAYGLLPGGAAPNDSSLRNVYLTSLCTEDDYIYMWVIYADKGTGCSLKFDENFFDVKDSYPQGYIPFHEEKNSYPLYRIVYLPDQDKKMELEESLKKLVDELVGILGEIYQVLPEEEKQEHPEEQQRPRGKLLRAYIAAMLDQVRYLFKYDEYSSEKEVRCLVVTKDRKMEPRDRDTPHVYAEMQRTIELEQVRFGPKVSKSPEKEAWMYATNRVKEVSYSNRHYR